MLRVRLRRGAVAAWMALELCLAWSCGGEDLRWRHVFTAVGDRGGEQRRGRCRCARAALGEREDARRRLGTAARGSSGVERRRRGVKRRRRRLRALATVWRNGGGAKGRRRRHEMEEMRAKQRGKGWPPRARHIYDRWDPRFSLTPVDPTPRV